MTDKSSIFRISPVVQEARQDVVVPCRIGLTLHVAARLMGVARKFKSEITLSNEKLAAAAKSVVSLLMFGATRGKVLMLTATGEDSDRAVSAVSALFGTEEALCSESKSDE